jgi:hypothetical protein
MSHRFYAFELRGGQAAHRDQARRGEELSERL